MRQRLVPAHIFGRVNGLISMLGLGTSPMAGFLTGMLAELIDIRVIFFVLGMCSFLVSRKFSWLTKLDMEIEGNKEDIA